MTSPRPSPQFPQVFLKFPKTVRMCTRISFSRVSFLRFRPHPLSRPSISDRLIKPFRASFHNHIYTAVEVILVFVVDRSL